MGFADKKWNEIGQSPFTADEAEKLTQYAETDEQKALLLKKLESTVIQYLALCSHLEDGGIVVGLSNQGEVYIALKSHMEEG